MIWGFTDLRTLCISEAFDGQSPPWSNDMLEALGKGFAVSPVVGHMVAETCGTHWSCSNSELDFESPKHPGLVFSYKSSMFLDDVYSIDQY